MSSEFDFVLVRCSVCGDCPIASTEICGSCDGLPQWEYQETVIVTDDSPNSNEIG